MDAWPEFEDPRCALGLSLRTARARLGLCQRDLAELLGWSKSKVARWESDQGPDALVEVQGALRLLGFALVVVELGGRDVPTGRDVPDGRDAADADDDDLHDATVQRPVEHVVDRAGRRFPAHLVTTIVNGEPTYWWSRYQGMPSPALGPWTYRRQTKLAKARELGPGSSGG